MRGNSNNLWYCLGLLAAGGLLIRLSFRLGSGAPVVLAMGVLALLGAMVIFWFNFRE